ncbi:DUF6868 family protein [Atopomonas sediminilitoris]|uniref:DUF6868 family protein n=1 Tax=Atopomonas sediminilitoris TaxID=2919919 RepID=UPI001F4E208B|nr:hypothetical protein [Atopomonas sediminilitoris]MCJ8168965.1 hypothetical protein [Atopomonas sediminilitoris]
MLLDKAALVDFFALCTLINSVLLLLATLCLWRWRTPIARLHSQLLGVPQADLPREYFRYLGNYKLLLLVFNLVPLVALSLT